jgi:hypothetical protein
VKEEKRRRGRRSEGINGDGVAVLSHEKKPFIIYVRRVKK